MRTTMIRAGAVLAFTAVAAAGCSASEGGDAVGGEDDQTPVTIEMWHFFNDREADVVAEQIRAFEDEYPWITVDVVSGQTDDQLLQAIRGGDAPDVAASSTANAVSSYCASGTFQDLTPMIEQDGEGVDEILPATLAYTSYEGSQCALPMLADVYGLYYNPELLEQAGVTEIPTTWDELTEVAKRLTKRSPDGTIEVAGFIPFLDFFEHNFQTFSAGWDLTWYTEDGAAAMAEDPQWAAMLEWQKELVDWYGYDNLQRFVSGLGDEWSAEHPFHTGQVAMMVDGEWRVAFLDNLAPELAYGTAPIPNVDAEAYGSGFMSGTTLGIPRGAEYPEAAWLLVKYLTTDTDALVGLAGGLRNVPTTAAALAEESIRDIEQFNVMMDIALHPDTVSSPGTPAGSAPYELLTQFAQNWQSGAVSDLEEGLADVASQIDAQIEQADAGNAP